MTFFCPICTDDLQKNLKANQEADCSDADNLQSQPEDANVSSLSCGHLFHTLCIQKWLCGNFESSKSCPCCRKPSNLTCMSLFPACHPTSSLSLASKVQDEEGHDSLFLLHRKAETLQRDLNDQTLLMGLKNSELENVRVELENKSELLDMKSEQLIDKSRECDILVAQLQKLEFYEDLYHNYKYRLRQTESIVSNYNRIFKSFLNNGTSVNSAPENAIHQIKQGTREDLEFFLLKIFTQWEEENKKIDTSTINVPLHIVTKWKTNSGGESSTIADDYKIILPVSIPQTTLPATSVGARKDTTDGGAKNTVLLPARPIVTLRKKGNNRLHATWSFPLEDDAIQMADVKFYEVYISKVNVNGPENLQASNWQKIGDVNAKTLPMGMVMSIELERGMAYVVILRGIDSFGRSGPFSIPQILYPD